MRHWNLLIALHALGAVVAVMIGAVVLRRRGKGGRVHRRLGTAWMVLMYWVVLSSFWIKQLHPGHFSWIHGLSAWTFLTLTFAYWAARTGRRGRHRDAVVGTYCGLVGAGMAAMAFPVRLGPQLLVHRPLVFAAAIAVAAMLTTAVVQIARRPARRQPRRAPAERGQEVAAAR
jgi:uncharacterized membrane protein